MSIVTYVFPPRPTLMLATPRPPSASPFCSSSLGPQFESNSDDFSTSASLSLESNTLCRAINSRNFCSVDIDNVGQLSQSWDHCSMASLKRPRNSSAGRVRYDPIGITC